MSPDQPPGPAPDPTPRYPRYPGERQPDPVPAPAHDPASFAHGPGAPPPAPAPPAWQGGTEVHDEPAGWWIRVLASLLDAVLVLAVVVVPFVGGLVLAFRDATYDEVTEDFSNVEPWGLVVTGASVLLYLLVDLWNRGLRVGYRGQSLGKQAVGVHVVGRDGDPVGPLEGFFRWLLAGLLQWTIIGTLVDLLWPLVDEQKQTLHDKAIGTYPVRRR